MQRDLGRRPRSLWLDLVSPSDSHDERRGAILRHVADEAAGVGPLSSQEVAERAGVAERSVREWLRNQAAGGYVTYDPDSDRYTPPDEHALALADEDSPFYILVAYELIASLYADEDKILETFRQGAAEWRTAARQRARRDSNPRPSVP
jgi:Rv2258c-like winged HTH domain